MIRLFKVYYPVRTLVLLVVEALVVGSVFSAGDLVVVPAERAGFC